MLIAISCAFIFCRFLYPGDTIFVSDEPNFQLHLDHYKTMGKIPFTNFRGSSLSFPYGSGAIYFYWPIRLLTNWPQITVLYHIFFVSLSLLFLFLALCRLFGRRPAAWALLIASTSPLLFLYSRHAWDNALLCTVSALLLYLFVLIEDKNYSFRQKNFLFFLIGLVVGYGLVIHLMFGPVAVASALTVGYFTFCAKENFKTKFSIILCFGLGCAVFALPYLWEAVQVVAQEKPLEHSKFHTRWGDGRNLWWTFQRTMIFFSLWGSRIYFWGIYPSFQQFVGNFVDFFFRIDLFGWLGKLAGWTLPFYVLTKIVRGKNISLAFVLAMFSFFITIFTLNIANIPTEPHYYNSVWWIVFLGFAWALTVLGKIPQKVLLVTALCTAVVNSAFLLTSAIYVHQNSGARNMNYSTILHAQQEAVTDFCNRMENSKWLEASLNISKVFLQPYSIRYHLNHLPECQGKRVVIDSESSTHNCRFHYPENSITSARLELACLDH